MSRVAMIALCVALLLPAIGAGPARPPDVGAAASALGDEPLRAAPREDGRHAASLPSGPSSNTDYRRVLGALSLVIALVFLLRWLGRVFFGPSMGRVSTRVVEVLARSPLSPRQQVMLLRVGRRLIVVGDSGSQMNALCELNEADEVAALIGQLRDEKLSAASKAFGAIFGRHRREMNNHEPPLPLKEAEDAAPVASAGEELSGLRERIRLLAEHFKG